MKPFAVVKLGPGQQKISIGDILITDQLDKNIGDKFSLEEVYMTGNENTYIVGTPTININVEVEVLSHEKGDKVRIHKFKAKSRYHKTTGFRACLTKLKVLSIGDFKEQKNESATKSLESKGSIKPKKSSVTSKTNKVGK